MQPFLGNALSKLLNPVVRFPCRYVPASRAWLWRACIGSRLAWRDYRYVARTDFGCEFSGTTTDVIQRYIYYFGIWEPFVSGFIRKRLKPGHVMIDIGANIGYISLLSSVAVGVAGRVVAIEASSRTFAKLQSNLSRNHAANVRPVWGAVWDHSGSIKLYWGPETNTGTSSIIRDFGNEGEIVPAGPLNRWLTDKEISEANLIKVDVEGAEIQVLRSILPLIPTLRDDVEIVCEVGADVGPSKDFSETLSRFVEAGFHVYELPEDIIANYFEPPSSATASRVGLPANLKRRTELVFSRRDEECL